MIKHILVVNPNVIEAEKIKSRMGSSTTEVVCAYTIQQAIRYFDEIEFCLVNSIGTHYFCGRRSHFALNLLCFNYIGVYNKNMFYHKKTVTINFSFEVL